MAQRWRSEDAVWAAVERMVGKSVSPRRRTFLNDSTNLVAQVMDEDEPEEIDVLVRYVLDFFEVIDEKPDPVDLDVRGLVAGSTSGASADDRSDGDKGEEEIEGRGWATEEERQRCEVLSRHVARQAGRSGRVCELRRMFLGGADRVLTPDQAFAFFESRALHLLGPDPQQPLPHQRYSSLGAEGVVEGRPKVLREGGAWLQTNTLAVTKNGATTRHVWSIVIADAEARRQPRPVQIPTRQSGATAFHGTWLRVLTDLCRGIAETYHWSERETLWFVVTGCPPAIEPVRPVIELIHDDLGGVIHAHIALRVQPFTGDAAVLAAVAASRRRMIQHLRPAALRARVGLGALYRRGGTWWLDYKLKGKRHREPSGSKDRRVAERLLQQRQDQIQRAIGHGRPPDERVMARPEDAAEVLALFAQGRRRTGFRTARRSGRVTS